MFIGFNGAFMPMHVTGPRWLWTMDEAVPREPADAGRDAALPLYANGPPVSAGGPLVVLLIADAAVLACLVFASFFLRTGRPDPWPPDGSTVPTLLRPAGVGLLSITAWLMFELADRTNQRDSSPRGYVQVTTASRSRSGARRTRILRALFPTCAGTTNTCPVFTLSGATHSRALQKEDSMTHATLRRLPIVTLVALAATACDRADEAARDPENIGADALAPGVSGNTGWTTARLEEAIAPRIHFAFDRSAIRLDDAALLDTKVEALQANPDARIRVVGHCDERGPVWYNEALGERRAEAARRYLLDRGIAADRIETVSFGESRPRDTEHTPQAWAANRRAEFEVLSGAPGGR